MYFFLYFFSLYTRIEKNLNWSRYSFRYYKNFAFVIWIQYNTLDQEIYNKKFNLQQWISISGSSKIYWVLLSIEPSFHQFFISMGFTRHLLISRKFCLLADSTLGYFYVLKIKLSK